MARFTTVDYIEFLLFRSFRTAVHEKNVIHLHFTILLSLTITVSHIYGLKNWRH